MNGTELNADCIKFNNCTSLFPEADITKPIATSLTGIVGIVVVRFPKSDQIR